MLLPSAIACEGSATQIRYKASLLASPPLSPPSSTHPTIYSTCCALQSMLSNRLPPPLPSPPTTHAEMPASPFKLRLRTRNDETSSSQPPRKKITKRAAAPPRGINKRRRAVGDDMSRSMPEQDASDSDEEAMAPSTPKRMRIAPEVLPLGLERSDFHRLEVQGLGHEDDLLESVKDRQGGEWSTEEDRILVELVLDKLKLSKSDWQDCARSLGKDRGSVGKRWKSLMNAGDVSLRNRGPRRSRIHSTWR